eukprot:9922966-Alexandrium_andersonii.AAC.1
MREGVMLIDPLMAECSVSAEGVALGPVAVGLLLHPHPGCHSKGASASNARSARRERWPRGGACGP